MAAIHPGNDGIRLPNGVRVVRTPHASRGGNPYPPEVREQVLLMYQTGGIESLQTPHLNQLRLQRKFPHIDTCKRWIRLHEETGHVLPKRATGNSHSEREIHGQDLFNLALFRTIRPKATIDEVRAYIHNRNPTVRPYSPSQVYRAEQRLGLSRKVASTTSDQAYRPDVKRRRRRYWTQSYPNGINDQSTADMIDIDEARFKLESQNRNRGKVMRHRRCDARGKYKKGEPGVSLIMGVSGDSQDPFEFHQQFSEGGTNLWRFFCFMEDFIEWLATNRPGQTFCFTMDNLNIHKDPIILDMIEAAGHRVVFRAPYWSCDGAIEYVFNTIHTMLQSADNVVDNVDELILEIDDIIFRMVPNSFRPYFVHVGFP